MQADKTTTKYAIKDRDGMLVAVHEHVKDTKTGEKQCYWRRPNGEPGLNGTRLEDFPLYGAHEMDPDAMLGVVVEGEPARDALANALKGAGVNVVATVTGAGGTPSLEALESLRGHEVVLWPDADKPGREHMARIAERLQGVAALVRVYDWPEAEEKDDAADHPAVKSGDEKAVGKLLNDLCSAPEYVPPEPEPGASVNGHRSSSLAPFKNTDLGNSERMVARHGEDLRYVRAWGRFLVYDDKRWTVDEIGVVDRMATETVRSIYGEAEQAPDESTRKELASHAMRSESRNRIEAMIALARSRPSIPARLEDLDADQYLLNVLSGTLDLRIGEQYSHRREDHITKLAPIYYDPNAKAPTWTAFLEKVLPSVELRRFVQRVVGYALTGDVSEQVLLFLYGVGANGKSTFLNTIMEMMGDYAMQAAPDLLTVKQGAHPTELADLMSARFVASIEVEDGRRLAESLVKQMTGGDRIKARKMRQDFFQFNPTHKLFLAANHKPVVRGTDHAIWRRIKMIPFEVTIPKNEQDPKLPEKLRAEMSGILAWAVEGCLDWQREGLGEPDEVKNATAEYRAEMDVLSAFLDECCLIGPRFEAKATPLYEAYKSWCETSGERPESQKRFGMRLVERGFEREKVGGLYRWYGIGLIHTGGPDPETGPSGLSGLKYDINDPKPSSGGVISEKGPNSPNGPRDGYDDNPTDDYESMVADRMAGVEAELNGQGRARI